MKQTNNEIAQAAFVLAHDLINDSIRLTTITRAEFTEALHDELSIESSDCTVANDCWDFWGTDWQGNEWRVILADPNRREDLDELVDLLTDTSWQDGAS